MNKYSGKFIHKIIRVFTQASFGSLNFMLPPCRTIPAQVASTMSKVEQALAETSVIAVE
jgi:starvation-inducible outer membrane lipoprotein